MREPRLIIVADDYGYRPAYNRGIVEAAADGAIDAVSAMVDREWCDPEPLLETGVEVGLHLELPGLGRQSESHTPSPTDLPTRRATRDDRGAAMDELSKQLERFEALFERPPAFLNGHHHCHAHAGLAAMVARVTAKERLPVRSVSPRHRRLLRCLGVATPDRLIGRYESADPARPEILAAGTDLPAGITEWMVHPGYCDPESGSDYDEGREEDLALLLDLRERLAPLRSGWSSSR